MIQDNAEPSLCTRWLKDLVHRESYENRQMTMNLVLIRNIGSLAYQETFQTTRPQDCLCVESLMQGSTEPLNIGGLLPARGQMGRGLCHPSPFG